MNKKSNIEEMKELAKERGGKCLSTKYVNIDTKLRWRCKEGHEWEAIPYTVKKGHWCPKCGRIKVGDLFRGNLQDMKKLATKKGGKCLSTEYSDSHTKLKWQCKEGHVWKAAPTHIKSGQWCPYCAGKVKLTIEEMQELAKQREGKCLSKEYVNAKTKLKWQCREGHIWEAEASGIKSGRWCAKCTGKAPLTLEEMHELAESNGGKCLSEGYVNARSKLKWRCKEGHVWEATPDNVKRRAWCPVCAGVKKLTIEEMQELANSKGGKCLSSEYINIDTKLTWRCKEGHVWEAIPYLIKSGSWCPICAIQKRADKRRGSIEEMQMLAKEKGGECLSIEYTDSFTHLSWKCKLGHEWEAMPCKIKSGYWCPICSTGVSERICRAYFEAIFGDKFPRKWPFWLVNERGNRMELDGYNKRLGLAFEYQGRQHYESVAHFHRESNAFKKRISDDKRKRELCIERDVALIEIPYKIGYEDMVDFIIKECKNNGVHVPEISSEISHTLFDIYSPKILEEMKTLAKNRGGECLSPKYINSNSKLVWKCSECHVWEALPHSVKKGHWCPICATEIRADKLRGGLEEFQRIAQKRGGKCLSSKYINSQRKLKWECKEGHVWEAVPNSIKMGGWCPICYEKRKGESQRGSIFEMQAIAEERGGNCLSLKYINSHTKLWWECNNGHIWKAIPESIKGGTWCPNCAGKHLLSIEEMHEIAVSMGGKCLSKEYINNQTKLKWQCKKGHAWEARPANIKKGHWCPYCAGKAKLTIGAMKILAKNKGGECLSSYYSGAHSKLRWRCNKGHDWKAKPTNIKSGKWCPYCAGNVRLTIKEMQKLAEENGGKCLSSEHLGARKKLKWQCRDGHVWKSTPDSVKNGRHWCPICARKRKYKARGNFIHLTGTF